MCSPLWEATCRTDGHHRWVSRGVTHEAGEVENGEQRCRRCRVELPLAPGATTGWLVGGLVEHEFLPDGETMHRVRPGQTLRFDSCTDGSS